jgi:hypothetical protein
MSSDDVLLGGVPLPAQLEAPSGWLSRLALSQGCTVEELMQLLKLRDDVDVDLQLHGDALVEFRRQCRLDEAAFSFSEMVVDGFHFAKLRSRWLLSDAQGKARFRVCPVCLGEPKNGGVMLILWRFAVWRYCPRHRCLTEERCFACRFHIKFPIDMYRTRPGREGFASQRRCQNCAVDLATAPRVVIDLSNPEQITERERRWLLAGRKFVATLCGEGCVDSHRLLPPIERLVEAAKDLPSYSAWPLVEARIRAQARRDAAHAERLLDNKSNQKSVPGDAAVILDPRWPWPVRR